MNHVFPTCSRNGSLSLLAKQIVFRESKPCLPSTEALLCASIAMAMHGGPWIKPNECVNKLRGYAQQVRNRVHSSQTQSFLAHLHDVLFEEMGLQPENQLHCTRSDCTPGFLPLVVEAKIPGWPIILSLIYKFVAEESCYPQEHGLEIHGIGSHRNFIVAIIGSGPTYYIDAADRGRLLTNTEVWDHFVPLFDNEQLPDGQFKVISNEAWASYLLWGLVGVFEAGWSHEDAAAMFEMLQLLHPYNPELKRQYGEHLSQIRFVGQK